MTSGGFNANPLQNEVEPAAGKIVGGSTNRSRPFNAPLPLQGFITVKTRFIKEFARFWRYNLVQPITPSRLDFLPDSPLTMKSISQNMVRTDFRPGEIRGQKLRRRGGLGPVGLVVAVRPSRPPGKFVGRRQSTMPDGVGYIHRRLAFRGQSHRHNYFWSKDVLPQKRDLSKVLPGFGRYNFVHIMSLGGESFCQTRPVNERKEPKDTAKTRRKPSPKSGDRVGGFRDFGSAANLLQSLQRPSAISLPESRP